MKCADCKFWVRFPKLEQIQSNDGSAVYFEKNYKPVMGWCCINPPTLQPRQAFSGLTCETKFPETHESAFCGKFEAKRTE